MRRSIQASVCVLACLCCLLFMRAAGAMHEALQFNEEGRFKLLIIADIQDGLHTSKYTLRLMEAALDQEMPDLVVLLGDTIYSLAPSIALSEENTKRAITNAVSPIVERGIPFCVVMGNHDSQARTSRKTLMEQYMSLPGCLAQMGDEGLGVGNYALCVQDKTGKTPMLNLWFIDSGSYAAKEEGGGYAYVTDAQIAWYESASAALREQNGGEALPAMLFQHIPVPEVYALFSNVEKTQAGAVRGHGVHANSYFTLNPEMASGYIREGACPPDINNGQFASWVEQGDVFAAFFGHDHVNAFVGAYQGIDLVQSPGVGFYAYGNGDEHGVRVVEIEQSDVRAYQTRLVYYKDVLDDPIPVYLQYMGKQVFMWGMVGAALLVCLLLLIVLLVRRKRRRRKYGQIHGIS